MRGSKIRFLILIVALFALTGVVNAASKFVPGINDLPLMQGLAPQSETPVVFDTPAGRIVEAIAIGKVSKSRIQSFYGATLPQLGWQPHQKNSFSRDKELLKIEISDDGKGNRVVRFSVLPGS